MTQKPQVANILASRYASPDMVHIWSVEGKIILEREFWIALMKAQRQLGLNIPAEAIAAYEKVKDQVDMASIDARERKNRHDVKARIEEFCDLAGYQHIHKGLTSRDLTDNIEQLQILRGLELVRTKYAACIYRLAQRSAEWEQVFLTGRTHNVAAQLTTWGKRLAMFGQEMLLAFQQFEHAAAHYPLRGIKGAVGTQLDQLTLFDGDAQKVNALEEKIAKFLGFNQELFAVGQVYPRSLDFEIISIFYQLGAGMSNFAKTLRIMAGDELATEGFKAGQVGSSAMPHKMNSRSSERLNGFHLVLNGFLNMAAGLAGDQWNEGDVSCSVVRRVALPNAFFTIDSMMETFLTILQEMGIYEAVIEKEMAEIDHYGGMLKAVEDGFVQTKIARQEYEFQQGLEKGEYIKIGVNKQVMDEEKQEVELHEYDEEMAAAKIRGLRELKQARDNGAVRDHLARLEDTCRKGENVMPVLVECCKSYATVGEMAGVFKKIYGLFEEPNIFK